MTDLIKVIGLNDDLPIGFNFLSSWECEQLLCNHFGLFKKIEIGYYYKLINPNKTIRYVWVARRGCNSDIGSSLRLLDYYGRARGVLVVKLEHKQEVKARKNANDDGIPPNNKLLDILPNEL